MIPYLSTIVSLYCIARLLGLAEDVRRRNRIDKEDSGTWIIYLLAAVAIAVLCFFIWQAGSAVGRDLDTLRTLNR